MDREEQERQRKREIQAAYRERNRDRINQANTARAILMRQNRYLDDAKTLADAIIGAFGKEYTQELHHELTTRLSKKRTARLKKIWRRTE